MKLSAAILLAVPMSFAPCMAATVSAPSTAWTALQGNFDFVGDEPRGQSRNNIVGMGTDYGLFVTHNTNGPLSLTDGTFGFRLRLDGPGGNNKNTKYDRAAYLGIDADFNDTIDVFIGVDFTGSNQRLGIYAPGSGSNSTPGSTSVGSLITSYSVNSTNYNYREVNYLTDGGTTNDLNPGNGETDYYLSVLVDFADIVSYLTLHGISVTDENPLRFIAATSNQGTSFQDIAGIDGAGSTTSSWSEENAFTEIVRADGTPVLPVPEPGGLLLAQIGALFLLLRRKR